MNGSSLPAIRYEHRILVTGATRSGKSTLARELFLSTAAPRLVIDPNDTSLTAIDGAEIVRDPRQLPKDAATVRFVPVQPDDRRAYDAVYKWAFENFPRYVWLDEPEQAAPASGYPRWANAYVAQGAKRMLGHLTCATRPRGIMRSLVANCQHLFAFELPNPDDRRHIADLVGLELATFEAAMAKAASIAVETPDGPKQGFLWWNQLTRKITVCPPLSLRR